MIFCHSFDPLEFTQVENIKAQKDHSNNQNFIKNLFWEG